MRFTLLSTGSYISSDAFIIQALTQFLHRAEIQAQQLSVDCLFTLSLDFAQQAKSCCYSIFQSMLSYLRIQLSPVHLQQLHLSIDDGGSSLPDICLIQQCA
jgi:hypothetical protein